MIDKFSQALTLMREAFEDAQAGAAYLPAWTWPARSTAPSR